MIGFSDDDECSRVNWTLQWSGADLPFLPICPDSICDDWPQTLQAMTNYSDLNMGNNIGKRDTQFFGQSNVFNTLFTNSIYPYLLHVVADNMEQCRYNILAQNISEEVSSKTL